MIGKKKKSVMEKQQDEMKKKSVDGEEMNNQEKTEVEKEQAEQPEQNVKSTDTAESACADSEAKIAELNDKYLRLYAEFDNYRRRTIREKAEIIQNASSDMMVVLLPVIDDFDRAVRAFEQSSDVNALKEGIILVQQKFRGILNQKGLEEMKSIGEVFDTDLHEAVANVEAQQEDQKNKVVDEIEKGYFLNGKVIRFAKVVVAN
jgi:molecular chaperone GrpE